MWYHCCCLIHRFLLTVRWHLLFSFFMRYLCFVKGALLWRNMSCIRTLLSDKYWCLIGCGSSIFEKKPFRGHTYIVFLGFTSIAEWPGNKPICWILSAFVLGQWLILRDLTLCCVYIIISCTNCNIAGPISSLSHHQIRTRHIDADAIQKVKLS